MNLQRDALEQLGIYHFDSWAANFGEVTTSLELSVEGNGFRFRNHFNKFVNLPELMNLFKEVADIRTRDTLDLKVPEMAIRLLSRTTVETVCLLSKGDVKSQKLWAEFSLEDMDMDGFKKGSNIQRHTVRVYLRRWIGKSIET